MQLLYNRTSTIIHNSVEEKAIDCVVLLDASDETMIHFTYRRILAGVLLSRTQVRTRIWRKPRSLEWWRGVQAGLYGEGWWRENLRLTKDTFDILCNELRPNLE